MAKFEFVAAIVDKLSFMEELISTTPDIVAEVALRQTLEDEPRPPWRTGELRASGAVYIGSRLHCTTQDLANQYPELQSLMGVNPDAPAYVLNNKMLLKPVGLAKWRHLTGELVIPKLMSKSFLVKGSTDMSGAWRHGLTVRNKIEVVYHAPHAAWMHEWTGEFLDPSSGAHYVSSKFWHLESYVGSFIRRVIGT